MALLLQNTQTVLTVVLGILAYVLYRIAFDPLRKVPGPWLARFTRLWELQCVRTDRFEQFNLELHEKYGTLLNCCYYGSDVPSNNRAAGPVVRTAPNRCSVSEPAALRQIYGFNSRFRKDRYYRSFGHPDDTQADVFTVIDEHRHATTKRKVAPLYSMTSLMPYEPFVDACTATLTGKLAQFATRGESVEIPDWMRYYAFDVIGELTVGYLCPLIIFSVRAIDSFGS